MNDEMFATLLQESERLKAEAQQLNKRRFLFQELSKKRSLILGIYGLRGTGKTTLLLQLAAEQPESVYVNAEKLVFRSSSISEFVEFAKTKKFSSFYIDEIHTSPNWAQEIKLLYDFGITNIIFSGSSSILIQESAADLSRRALLFYLPPLSFREFLDFVADAKLEKAEISSILDFDKRKKLISAIAPYASHFSEYMRYGSFPFYFAQKADAPALYERITEKIVRTDLSSLERIDSNYISSVYKIINTLVISNPSEITYNALAKQTSRKIYLVEKIISDLSDLGLLHAIMPFKRGASMVRKEKKFLISPPFRLAIGNKLGFTFEQLKGGIREDLFVSNTHFLHPAYVKTDRERKTPDYYMAGKTFELGPHAFKHDTDFYVKDELVVSENAIPLPLLCMLF